MAPTFAPELKIPVAKARSFFGKYSAVALIAAGKIFEINTGAISRGYRQTPYPAEPLLRLLREMDGKILFTADAHRACDVAFGYAEAVELACRCGFDTFWRLTEEGFVPAPLHRALT